MFQLFGILSGLIALYSSFHYIRDIIRCNTKPHRMAWVIFITLSGVSFFAQLAEGATNSLWFPLVLFVQAIIIFSLTLKYGVGGFGKYDVMSLILAILIMIVWVITKSPAIAIICTVSVNTIGKALVAAKTYKHPHSEYLPTWLYSVLASILSALAVGKLNWILLITPIQNALTVGAIAGIIIYRRKQLRD
jgi:hypothetical protein